MAVMYTTVHNAADYYLRARVLKEGPTTSIEYMVVELETVQKYEPRAGKSLVQKENILTASEDRASMEKLMKILKEVNIQPKGDDE